MFHLSRLCGDSYYVYDDDKCTETELSGDELESLINSGVEINGISNVCGHTVAVPVVYSYSAKSAKYKMIMGVDYQVNDNNELLLLYVNNSNTVVKLSDICDSIGAHSFRYIEKGSKIIIDDNIKSISEKAFSGLINSSFTYDLTGIKDDNIARTVYENGVIIIPLPVVSIKVLYSIAIIDNIERFERITAELCIFRHKDFLPVEMKKDVDDYILFKKKQYLLDICPSANDIKITGVGLVFIERLKEKFAKWGSSFSVQCSIRYRALSFDISDLLDSNLFSIDIDSLKTVYCYLKSGGRDKDIVQKYYDFLCACASFVLGV